ncbi:di-trans,poly-cis-decaprenylcistransferase [Propionibacterium sp. oral taxon 192 str. F0372]|nr:isoprenyl transferase [Propionibacterium sp. oral taxon 192]EPH02297.1 di-trans,poly-cis-decaprenylcistransferase [Propionibacterium sp. oral taxon 192 str. F0372]
MAALDRFSPGNLSWLYRIYESQLRKQIHPGMLPAHVAVLADGNRRWARTNAPGEPLKIGYWAGANKLRQFARWCDDIGIKVVTLWVLSTDNLNRAESDELLPLLDVIVDLVRDLADSRRYQVMIVGDLRLLPGQVAADLQEAAERTSGIEGMHINIAVSYGGRHELTDAVRSLLTEEAGKGTTLAELAERLDIDQISEHLYTKGQPDPDLIIRTSGEQRLSGFLMWQSAHSEFYFCEALWPDFRRVDFFRALRDYEHRERRFGK